MNLSAVPGTFASTRRRFEFRAAHEPCRQPPQARQANTGPPRSDDSDRDGLLDPNHHNDAHRGSWRFIGSPPPQPQLKDHT